MDEQLKHIPEIQRQELPVMEQKLPFNSFLARFYDHNGRVVKIYNHEDVWGGVIELSNEHVRNEIIDREIACSRALATAMEHDELTVLVPNEEGELVEERALIMNYLEESSMLDDQMQTQEIPEEVFRQVALKLVNFHFNEEACPTARVYMTGFLRSLFANEIAILAGKFPDQAADFAQWEEKIMAYIEQHAEVLDQQTTHMAEPVVGHGDVLPRNIARTAAGETMILDPAPVLLWQVNHRRMDAEFMHTELLLQGKYAEAEAYWETYTRAYDEYLEQSGLSPEALAQVQAGIPVVDDISRLYRLMIFYRLGKSDTHHGNQQRAQMCEQMMLEWFQRQ